MLLMSSDAVFDGASPPYTPTHPTSPLTQHGRIKVVAEACVTSALPSSSAILRVPVAYGRVSSLDESPVTSVIPR